MSTADTAYRLILTAISLIAFMASTILSYTVEYQWKRSTSPWNSIRTKSLTVSKGTQDKFNHGVIYERRIFYYSSRWHVYQKGLYTGLLTVFPASESSCVGNLYVLKGLKFSRGIFGVLGLPRYSMRAPGMSLIKYAPLFPRLASQLPWSSHHPENVSSACKATLKRREYVKVLAKSVIRRKVEGSQIRLGSISSSYHPTRSPDSQKTRDLRKALVGTLGASALKRQSLVIKEKEAPHAPKKVRLEHRMRLALGENLSIKNLASAAAARKAPAPFLPDNLPSRIPSQQSKTRYQNQKSSRRSLFHEAAATSFKLFATIPAPL